MTNGEGLNHNPQSYICKNCDIIARILKRAVLGSVIRGGGCNFLKCKQADVVPASHAYGRAGGTGPAAPVLAGPIFQAPTIFFQKKLKRILTETLTCIVIVLRAQGVVKRHFDC